MTYVKAYLLQLVVGVLLYHTLGTLSERADRLVLPPLF